MALQCPHCGSKHIRKSLSRGISERLAELLGVLQLRCRECDLRFRNAIWDFSNSVYARCPRCYRQKLTRWDPEKYHVTTLRTLLMYVGARPLRCDACRCNFVSFRPRKTILKRLRRRSEAEMPASEVA